MFDQAFFFRQKFLPLFCVQFLNAFNDNFFKSTLVVFIAFQLRASELLVTLAAGVFILPFLLFSRAAGNFCDRYDKALLLRRIKFVEIWIMLIGSLGFYTEQVALLFVALFLMGIQSAFFGPVKYAILPDHLEERHYIAGNTYIGAGTFLAILAGTILGIFIGNQPLGGTFLPFVYFIGVAFCGWVLSLAVPPAPAQKAAARSQTRSSLWRFDWGKIKASIANPKIKDAVVSISWFWFLGASLLSQLPNFPRYLGGDEQLYFVLLIAFVVGIGAGSLWCRLLLKERITTKYSFICLLGMSLFLFDVQLAASGFPLPTAYLTDQSAVYSTLEVWQEFSGKRVILGFAAIAFFGGWYVAPFYAVMQKEASEEQRGQVISINNIFNAAFMVSSAAVIVILQAFSLSLLAIFMVLAFGNLVFAFCRRLLWAPKT